MNNLLRLESECQILGRIKTSQEKEFIFAQYFNVLRGIKKKPSIPACVCFRSNVQYQRSMCVI